MSPPAPEPSWVARGARFTLGAVLVLAVLALAAAAAQVLLLTFIAIILAAGLQPVIAWLRGHLRLGRGASILLVYGTFFVGVIAFATLVLPAAASQLGAATERLPAFIDRIREWAAGITITPLATTVSRLADAAQELLAAPSTAVPSTGQVLELGLTVVEVVVSVVTVLTVVYYWLVEHARLQRYVLAFVPAERRAGARDTWNEVETRLGMWVRGQLILMGAIGLATGAVTLLLGVPGAILLGLIAALTEAIPLIGPYLGAIPAVLLAATVSPELALVTAGAYAILQLIEANVLLPVVMRHSVGISPFVVLLSLLIGGITGGVVGAFLAVPVAAAFELLMEHLQARDQPVAQDPTVIESATAPDQTGAPDTPTTADGSRSTAR